MNLTPEIEVFYMLLERSRSIFSVTYLKLHIHVPRILKFPM